MDTGIQAVSTCQGQTSIVQNRGINLTEKLIAENIGILNWLIAGYVMWRKEGLGEPDAIREANEEYRMDMDSVGTFVNDCFEIDASLKWKLGNKVLYDTYLKWCNTNNERPLSHKGLVCGCRRKVLSGVLVIVKGSGWNWFCGMNGGCDLAKGSPR